MYKRHISSLNSELSERCGARKRRRTNDGGWKDACTTNDNDDDGASEMDEETAAKEKMKKLIAEKQALEDEMRKVQAILDDHQRRREEHEYDAKKCTQCGKAAMLHCEAGDGEYEECCPKNIIVLKTAISDGNVNVIEHSANGVLGEKLAIGAEKKYVNRVSSIAKNIW
eukprot:CAMPEP_0202696600 /NCGR_PEP_ID=MMETSP1385-20130828/9892_1 /ASSEMBLY_ACC=CAM_ASM_000861 /TAXON_ID=933848 /ORGANISM="Elphidium margaritaceum" /LENGTH=168 /DNA_ID=CAMNT_0049352803 /DNA_START=30 /DNA_END=534 /DNA_ORIENTATION=+